MSTINFTVAAKRQMARLFAAVGLSEAPELCENRDWFQRLAYRTPTVLLFIDCELARGYGVDILFRSLKAPSNAGRDYSIDAFLRIHDPPTALRLGYSLPNDQRDMDDLLSLYGDALLKHRHAIFDDAEVTTAAMERVFQETDFANQAFSRTGQFCG